MFDDFLEKELAEPWSRADGWQVVYMWADKEKGYYIDEEYSATSDDYEDFKKEYFEYCSETILHSYYTTDQHGRRILNILLLRED